MGKETARELREKPISDWPFINQLFYYWLVVTNADARRGFLSSTELYESGDTTALGLIHEQAASFKLSDLLHPNRSKSD